MLTMPNADSVAARGDAALMRGDAKSAIALYGAALAQAPERADFEHKLGFALLSIGNDQAAFVHLDRACRLAPTGRYHRMRRGIALQRLGRIDDALADYQAHILSEPGDAIAWSNVAAVHQARGNMQEAVAAARRATELDPAAPIAWNNLGNALYLSGDFVQAEHCLRRALQVSPEFVDALSNLADVLRAMFREIEAERLYLKALQLDPAHVAASINLGNLYVARGRNEEAIRVYSKALEKNPGLRDAESNLSSALIESGREKEAADRLRPYVESGEATPHQAALYGWALILLDQTDEAVEIVKPHLSSQHPAVLETWAKLTKKRPELLDSAIEASRSWLQDQDAKSPLPIRSSVRLNLAHQLEQAGRYAEAFAAAASAKALNPARADGARDAALLSALKRAFSAARLGAPPRGNAEERRPVFVVGMPRSGTSLVEQILASHREIFGAGEVEELNRIASEFGAPFDVDWTQRIADLDEMSLRALAARWTRLLEVEAGTATYIVDKMPHNFVMLGAISLFFPGAKVIHVRRDPRDTCLSIFFSDFTGHHPYSHNLIDLARHYIFYSNLMEHWKEVLPLDFAEIRYEDLVGDTERESRRLLQFLGLDWDPAVLSFYASKRAVLTTSRLQVKNPIYSSSIGRWKNYQAELGPLVDVLDPVLRELE